MIIDTTSLKEQTSEKSERFVRSFELSRNAFEKLSDTSVINIILLLNDFREEINELLKFGSPDDPNAPFNVRVVPGIQSSINDSLITLKVRSGKEISDRLADGFDLGSGVTFRAASAVGLPVAFPQVSPAVLTTLSRDAVNVFESLADVTAQKVANEINLSVAGLQSSSQARRKINRILKSSPEFIRGRRRRIGSAFQAEEIVRTEVGRVFSNAQQAASEQLARSLPGLRKRWLTVGGGRVRQGHRDIQRATRPGGETGPILINRKFKVTDFSRTGTTNFLTLGGRIRPKGFTGGLRVARVDRYVRRGKLITDHMLFPRDPSASAGNVIQCRCTVIDVIPELERAMDKSMGIIRKGQS